MFHNPYDDFNSSTPCVLCFLYLQVDIFQVYVIEMKEREGSPLFHLEHFIEGKYIKYNSNSGFVRQDETLRCTPQVTCIHDGTQSPALDLTTYILVHFDLDDIWLVNYQNASGFWYLLKFFNPAEV